jgi:molecular chaperone DnaK
VKEALKGTDTEAIKAANEELTKAFYDISSKIYQANAGQPGPDGTQQHDDNTVDADYKVEDDKQ